LGLNSTRGLGAGMRPDIGRQAAEETIHEITEKLEGSHMLFVAAGMGGGTGTGAAPVIAKLARERGILTVGVVTKPFHFEGSQRMKLAEKGIEELQQFVDTLLTIPNQNLFRIANEKTTFSDAFKMADDVLYAGVRGVTDLMVQPGMINLDFSDIKTVMSEMGKAMMGTGEASGEGRAVAAAEAAIANPLIDDVSLKGAKGLIINITGGKDITLYEVDEAANRIKQEVDEEANIIYGTTCDDRLDGLVRVSIVATGIDSNVSINAKPLESFSPININNDVYKSNQINQENIDDKFLENDKNLQEIDNQLDVENNIENDQLDNLNEHEENLKEEIVSNYSSKEMSDTEEDQDSEDVILDNENFKNFNNQESETSETPLISDKIETEHEDQSEELNASETSETPLISDKIETEHEDQSEELNASETSVRRLSLFDNISSGTSGDLSNENDKTEPVISENIFDNSMLEGETLKEDSNEKIEPEFSATDDELEEDFNQETEEELLDIPTFLRRQAN
jgi:cell division protein FtsZ